MNAPSPARPGRGFFFQVRITAGSAKLDFAILMLCSVVARSSRFCGTVPLVVTVGGLPSLTFV